MRLSPTPRQGRMRRMSDADYARSWLAAVLAHTGLSVAELAKRAGVSKSTLFRAMRPDYQFVTSARTLQRIAEAADYKYIHGNYEPPEMVDREDIILGVLAYVEPDVWQPWAVDPEMQLSAHSPIAANPAFHPDNQQAWQMRGTSMNEFYNDGDLIHTIDIHVLPFEPTVGDHVVFRRFRRGTDEVQWSVREIASLKRSKVELRFRSRETAWRERVVLDDRLLFDGENGDFDGDEVSIDDLVIGSYRKRSRMPS